MPLGRLSLGVVLAVLSAITIQVAAFLVLAALDALTGARSSAVATAVLDAGSVVAWSVAGAIAYEVVRERVAVVIVAALPLLVALLVALAGAGGAHLLVWGGVAGVIAFALVLGAATWLGGLVWRRHLRPSTSLD